MKDYKTLEELNELIEKELKKMVQKGDLTPNELESAEKAVCLMEKIIRLKEDSYSENGMDGNSRGYYMDGSYERGRSPYTDRYVSRDGRYSMYDPYNSGNYYDQSNRGYSGHSISDRAVDCLERMMDDAGSDYEREKLKRFISQIRADEMK